MCGAIQIVKLAKRLRKEKVNVDVVNFGEEVGIEYCHVAFCLVMFTFPVF